MVSPSTARCPPSRAGRSSRPTEHSFTTRFDFGDHPELLASFPFPHELWIRVAVEATTLRVATTVAATTDRSVPVAFGYHPYLRIPGVRRADVHLRLPARRHVELDDRGLPTGAARPEDAEDEPLGSRTFDDLYQLDADRRLELTGGGRRLALELGDGYPFAQVFTPDASDSVCLEPMTAAVNALVDGSCALVAPGSDVHRPLLPPRRGHRLTAGAVCGADDRGDKTNVRQVALVTQARG